ncbi:TRAP transporter substrate-binding protein [Hydrogenophaga sp.]|uniref:TRAP transporter substrate-binding protein n=1 Tax=Hydrogenophaga sp. TaxID=1904254 RepID=UPI00261864FB|nr:TRAP transporter substrate-binding protein [Hydrogenophaga sp.]MCW5653902.1 TRAP transporter substrate-binding protein [Hydrogenophaga sp.]
MSIQRRTLLAASAGAPFVLTVPRHARAAEFNMKWGCFAPPDHPLSTNAVEAARKINAETKGRVEINYFPSSQLGGDTDMLAQVRAGALDFYTTSASFMTTLNPSVGPSALGFAFKDYATIWKAVDGDVGQVARRAAAAANIHIFEKFWDLGFRTVSHGSKPVSTLADMQGMKIRVPVLPMFFNMFKALGAAPVSMNFSELYTSLQTKLVDGQENPLVNVFTAKFYEVQKFISLTNHCWEGMLIASNRNRFNSLPADIQEVITRNINAAALKEREDMSKLTADVRTKLEAQGVKFNEIDIAPFRERLKQAGYYKEWRGKMGDETWAAIEKYAGSLS